MPSTEKFKYYHTNNNETLKYDVIIVGAGLAGLSAAIKIKQLAIKHNKEISICVLEKASEIGAHIISGALINACAINELFPDWKLRKAPISLQVTESQFFFLLNSTRAWKIPNWILPKSFINYGNYIVSASNIVKWLGKQAELLGIEIFPSFPATSILYNKTGSVIGVTTGSVGINQDGKPSQNFQYGVSLIGKYTLFAEGAHGHLGRQLEKHYALRNECDPQVYSIGIKEIWEINPIQHKPGLIVHTIGWPLDKSTYGGSFLYHIDNCKVALGFIVGLNYRNPYLSPFEEFQRYKTHPQINYFLKNGKRIAYGARVIASGGLTSLPKLVFPGGALIGCEAGFLNPSSIKGCDNAIKSGILAANAVFHSLGPSNCSDNILHYYPNAFKNSSLYKELYQSRNFKYWINKSLYLGYIMANIEQKLKGKVPWTLHHRKSDHEYLQLADKSKLINYPKPDNILSFNRISSLFLSNINHKANQPSHLLLKNYNIPITINFNKYAGLESRYCPAAVYEFIVNADKQNQLIINSQNCIHCKTCDIKDPTQNIIWIPPEGGSGPNYSNM